MLSFTCARRHDIALDKAIGNLGSLCLQMRYAWWGALAVGALEVLALIVIVWGWCVSRGGSGEGRTGAKESVPLGISLNLTGRLKRGGGRYEMLGRTGAKEMR